MIINKIQEPCTLQFIRNFCNKSYFFKKIFNSEFQDTEVWFTDQHSQLIEIEDRLNLTLVIK